MRKITLSQPIRGLTEQDITNTKDKVIKFANDHSFEFVNSSFLEVKYNKPLMHKEGVNIPLYYLADSLRAMSNCDIVYFAKGWNTSRRCRIEHAAAKDYGLELIYEDELISDLIIHDTIY